MKRAAIRSAVRTSSGLVGEKMAQSAGSDEHSSIDWLSSSKQATMASCSLKQTSRHGNGGWS
jgi:hypothetical protein